MQTPTRMCTQHAEGAAVSRGLIELTPLDSEAHIMLGKLLLAQSELGCGHGGCISPCAGPRPGPCYCTESAPVSDWVR